MKNLLQSTALLLLLALTSCSGNKSKDLVGQWQVVDVKINLQGVPQELLDNAAKISFGILYEFAEDKTYTMTIAENELQPGCKRCGPAKFDGKQLAMEVETLYFDLEGAWEQRERDEMNGVFFKTMDMKVTKPSPDQLIFTANESGGTVVYTLAKVLD